MKKLRLACVVGARPNFMKMAPLLRAFEAYPQVETVLIHTGQHYDRNLSDVFFEELGIKHPDVSLNVGSGSHGVQTAQIIEKIEQVLQDASAEGTPFDRLIVVGDVNSTMAATLASVKLGVPVAHVEAGLRSFDRTMPEEINRIVTDALSDMLLVSEPSGIENLKQEGKPEEQLYLVGNVMIDTLMHLLPKARQSDVLSRYELQPSQYGLVTLHRPANVDDPKILESLLDVLIDISKRLKLIFPIHPRTEKRLTDFGLLDKVKSADAIVLAPPLGYLDFLALSSQAKVIVTDSGGLQEESTVLGVPCLTLRPNTERPCTTEGGTSTLIGNDAALLNQCLEDVLEGRYKNGTAPKVWDGKAAERIANVIVERC